MYMYIPTHVNTHLSLQRSVIETRQIKATTPEDNSSFRREKEELSQVGFEPAMFYVLGRRSTTKPAQLGRLNL